MNLESIVILTILGLPIHEHRMSFHLFRSLISFIMFVVFSVSVAFFLLNLSLSMLSFDVVLNGIVFLIHFQIVINSI